ncbi:hypothetical protein [Paraliomyxa miuraensis]|uniref:hypothetical protein n=1 Tax=Paraliomyxa miuraensis TaxID=376150 RepID=UPI0022577695|nr:hypothetical protein [Paraliomyxa miuraensis]MCX4240823.1 hypothetical protein [Paraliomyxa miuraensis]
MTRSILLSLLSTALLLSGCDKKDAAADGKAADDKAKKDDKADAKADVKAETKEEPEPETKEEPKPEEVKAPELEPLALETWGVTMSAPKGAKLGEFEDGEGITADTVDIDAEEGCGVEIELYRHRKSKDGVAEMFKNATGPSGNKDDQFPIKESDDNGYRVKHSWVIPLGDTMWSVEVGKVLGDHLYLCGAGTLMGVEEKAAECALAACETLALTGG